LTPLGVPHAHIHGREDVIVPLELVEHYAAAAVRAGDRARLEVLPDAGHFELVDARTAAGQCVVDACVRLTA
jgi:pimeloyl-ACP methyl ester carboxylesterase